MNARAAAIAAVALALFAGVGYWAWQRLEPLPPPTSSPASFPPRVIGFRLNVERTGENAFAFSRAELEAALKDPYQFTHLGRLGAAADGSGVEVVAAPRGSLTQRFGLQAGDVIQSVNGQAVATPRDLGRIYLKDYQLPQMHGQVRRGTRTLRFSYVAR